MSIQRHPEPHGMFFEEDQPGSIACEDDPERCQGCGRYYCESCAACVNCFGHQGDCPKNDEVEDLE